MRGVFSTQQSMNICFGRLESIQLWKLCCLFAWFENYNHWKRKCNIGLFLYKGFFNVFQVLELGKVSSSMMGTFGALLEIILILYPFDFLPFYTL